MCKNMWSSVCNFYHSDIFSLIEISEFYLNITTMYIILVNKINYKLAKLFLVINYITNHRFQNIRFDLHKYTKDNYMYLMK